MPLTLDGLAVGSERSDRAALHAGRGWLIERLVANLRSAGLRLEGL